MCDNISVKPAEGHNLLGAFESALCRSNHFVFSIGSGFFNRNLTIIIAFEVRERNPYFVLGGLCIIGCPVQINKGSFFEIASSSSSTHICLALRPLLTFCITLTR